MRNVFAFILVAALAAAHPISAQLSDPPDKQQLGVRAQYADLNRRIYSANQYPSKAEHEEITTQLRSLVTDETMAALVRAGDAAKVRKAIADVQGEFSFSSWGSDMTNVPFAERFEIYGQPGLAVGFVVLRGGSGIPDTLPVVQFYIKTGEWKLGAETDADFHGCTFMISSLDSPVPSETWWLVWGQTIGDTGARRKVRLYAFDGGSLRTVWQRNELEAGSVKVAKDGKTIVLEYYRKVGTPELPRAPLRIREEWVLTLNGPQQVSSQILGDAGRY